MENYTVSQDDKWDYENGFYLTSELSRIGKVINHLEIYKKIVSLPGDIIEFGVYKGSSFIRLASFRDLLETALSRKIVGFDIFGKFPNVLSRESDKQFVKKFEGVGGYGISKDDLAFYLDKKGIKNYQLIKGNIEDTLLEYISENPALRIALLHIDVDVYEPTKMILDTLWDRVVTGGIVMLDDYGTVAGESEAVDEFFSDKDVMIQKPPYNYIPSYIVK